MTKSYKIMTGRIDKLNTSKSARKQQPAHPHNVRSATRTNNRKNTGRAGIRTAFPAGKNGRNSHDDTASNHMCELPRYGQRLHTLYTDPSRIADIPAQEKP